VTDRSDDSETGARPAPSRSLNRNALTIAQGIALAGVIAITVIITLWVSRDSAQPGIEIFIPPPAPVTFQVSGEVMRPGVYSLDGDPRIDDVINVAGGLTPDADDRRINLALRVRDGAKVVIPARSPVDGPTAGLAGKDQDASDDSIGSDLTGPVTDGDSSDAIVSDNEAMTGLIDLNTATKDQLVTLPGIGDVRAESIIEWRTNNLISSVDDLLAISGIGPSTVDSIRSQVIQP